MEILKGIFSEVGINSSLLSFCLVFQPSFFPSTKNATVFMNRLEFSCFPDILYGFFKPEKSMVFFKNRQ
jgi:hypothetical protein